jgi:hypothetical protein
MALVKARFHCDAQGCDAEIDVTGAVNQYGEYLKALQDAGWRVVAEGWTMRHYCVSCEPKL